MNRETFWLFFLLSLAFFISGVMGACSCDEELAALESYLEVTASMDVAQDTPENRFDPISEGLAFGDIQRGFSRTAFVYVANTGSSKMIVNEVAIEGEGATAYQLADFEPETPITSHNEIGFSVIFAPPGSGKFDATLKIVATDKATPEVVIKLSGEGVDITVNDVDFGGVKIKDTKQDDVVIAHTYKGPIKIGKVYFTDNSSDMFVAFLSSTRMVEKEKTGKTEFEKELQPGENFNITISYRPLKHSEDNAELIIEIVEPQPVTLTSKLSGYGISPTIAIARDSQTRVEYNIYSALDFDFGVVTGKKSPNEPDPQISFYILNIGDGNEDLEIYDLAWLDINTGQKIEDTTDQTRKFSIIEKPNDGDKIKAITLPQNEIVDLSALSPDEFAKVTVSFDNAVALAETKLASLVIDSNDSITERVQANFSARVPSARIIRYPIGGYKLQIQGADEDGDHLMDPREERFAFKACNAGEIPLQIYDIKLMLQRTNSEFIPLDTNKYPYSVDATGFPITLQPEATEELRKEVGAKNDCSNATDVLEFDVVGNFTEAGLYFAETIDAEGKVSIPVVIFESSDPNKPCTDSLNPKFGSDCPIPLKIQILYTDTYQPTPKIVKHPKEGYTETLQGAQEKRFKFVACNGGDAYLSIDALKLYVEGNSNKYELMTPGQFPYTIDAPPLPVTLTPEPTKADQDAVLLQGDCSNATNKYEFEVVGDFQNAGEYFSEEVGKYSVPAVVIESSDPKTPCNVSIDPSFDRECAMHLKINVE
ncbi:MAG: hypothetical protein Kow0090_14880 [Myxococcota bacterium]